MMLSTVSGRFIHIIAYVILLLGVVSWFSPAPRFVVRALFWSVDGHLLTMPLHTLLQCMCTEDGGNKSVPIFLECYKNTNPVGLTPYLHDAI